MYDISRTGMHLHGTLKKRALTYCQPASLGNRAKAMAICNPPDDAYHHHRVGELSFRFRHLAVSLANRSGGQVAAHVKAQCA